MDAHVHRCKKCCLAVVISFARELTQYWSNGGLRTVAATVVSFLSTARAPWSEPAAVAREVEVEGAEDEAAVLLCSAKGAGVMLREWLELDDAATCPGLEDSTRFEDWPLLLLLKSDQTSTWPSLGMRRLLREEDGPDAVAVSAACCVLAAGEDDEE